MIAELNENQIEELLKRQVIGRIGCHANGVTYVVPISYAYDGQFVYACTFEGMKTAMMRKNPNVCFEVDDTKDITNWQSVIAWGVFEELNKPEERNKALHVLINRGLALSSSVAARLDDTWPFLSGDAGKTEGIIFRIRLKEKTGRFERYENAVYSNKA